MIDEKKVKAQTEEAAQRSGRFRYLKKNATTLLRILEFEDADGDVMFAQPLVEHRRRGAGGKSLGICRSEIFGEPCAFCRANQKARDTGEEASFISRTRYIVNGIDIENEANTMRLWVIPTTVFSAVAEYALDDEWKDILEPKTGLALSIKRSGSGLDTEYITKPTRKAYPVNKGLMKMVQNPLDSVRDVSLDTQCKQIGVDVEDLFDDTEVSPKSSKSEAKTPSPRSRPPVDDGPVIDVGSPVHHLDEEQVCHVVTIDGDDVEIEDPEGEKFDVLMSELSLVKEEGEGEPEDNWEIGSRVLVDIDGEDYAGEIKSIKGDIAKIKFDDGDVDTYSLDGLKEEPASASAEPEPAEPEAPPEDSWAKDDRCVATIDGDKYAGVITLIKGDKANVTFDDGDKEVITLDELEEEEDATSDSPEPAEPVEKPACYADKTLYSAKDKECKECDSYEACGGEVELDKAGVGKSKQQLASEKAEKQTTKKTKKVAKKTGKKASPKSSADTDSIVAGIVGG